MVSGNVTTTAQQLEQIKSFGFYRRHQTAYECIIDGCIVRRVNRKDEVPGYFIDDEWQPWGSFNGIADILSMMQFNVIGGHIILDDAPEYPGRPITDDLYESSLQGSIRGLDGRPVLDMMTVTETAGAIPITESRLSDIRFMVNDACRWYGDRKFKGRIQPDVPMDKLKEVIQWIADMNPYARAYIGEITCPEGEWARQMQIEYYQSIGMGSAINERTIELSDITRWLVDGPDKGSVSTLWTQFEVWFKHHHHNEPMRDMRDFIHHIESELVCDCFEAPNWHFEYQTHIRPDTQIGVMDFIEITRPPAIFDSEYMVRAPSTYTDGGGTDGSRWP